MSKPRITLVQYDGEGEWIDIWFTTGEKVRFEAYGLYEGYKTAQGILEKEKPCQVSSDPATE